MFKMNIKKGRREGIREKKFEINKLNAAKKKRSSKKEKKMVDSIGCEKK